MWPDRVSNPGPLTYESGALPTALRGPACSTRYHVTCNVYTGYLATSEIEHGFPACTVDNPLANHVENVFIQVHDYALSFICSF